MQATFRRTRSRGGFSLVEVVVALGIVGVSCITIIGLLTTATVTLHSSLNATTYATIVQKITVDLQQADYSTLISTLPNAGVPGATLFYFDDQGNDITTQYGAGNVQPAYVATVTVASTISSVNGAGVTAYAVTNQPNININGSKSFVAVTITIQNATAGVANAVKNATAKSYTIYVAQQ